MPKFAYKAKEGPERIIEGIMEAENREQVVDRLQGLGYFPVSIVEDSALKSKDKSFLMLGEARIRTRDLTIFTRQLSDLLDSGITLFKSLNLIEEQTENLLMRQLVYALASEIKDGKRFSETLTRFPRVFSNLYVALVRAGEVGGMLDKILLGLADYLEKEEELRARVRTALAYPLLMASVGVMTIFILMSFVIPRLVVMFRGLGQDLPLPTLILINLSSFLSRFWWLVLAVLGLVYFEVQRRMKTKDGKFFFDQIKLRIPFFGELFKKSDIARFGRTLSTLLGNGVPMLVSLETVRPVADNVLIQKEIERMFNEVRDGASLSKSIAKSPYFPHLVSNMIAVGEEGGVLEKSLFKVSQSYEREVERIIKVITSLIEPAMILVMGSIVGFIVISMLLPIFQINLVAW
jgi:type II secretion system protein F